MSVERKTCCLVSVRIKRRPVSVGQLHKVLVRLVWLVGRILRDRWTRDCCTQPCEDDELVLMRRWYCCRSHAETITPLQPAK